MHGTASNLSKNVQSTIRKEENHPFRKCTNEKLTSKESRRMFHGTETSSRGCWKITRSKGKVKVFGEEAAWSGARRFSWNCVDLAQPSRQIKQTRASNRGAEDSGTGPLSRNTGVNHDFITDNFTRSRGLAASLATLNHVIASELEKLGSRWNSNLQRSDFWRTQRSVSLNVPSEFCQILRISKTESV